MSQLDKNQAGKILTIKDGIVDNVVSQESTFSSSKIMSIIQGSEINPDSIDVTNFASQDDITSLWTALNDLTNVVDAIVDKLSTNTAVAATLSDDTVADEPGLID